MNHEIVHVNPCHVHSACRIKQDSCLTCTNKWILFPSWRTPLIMAFLSSVMGMDRGAENDLLQGT